MYISPATLCLGQIRAANFLSDLTCTASKLYRLPFTYGKRNRSFYNGMPDAELDYKYAQDNKLLFGVSSPNGPSLIEDLPGYPGRADAPSSYF